MSGILRTSLRRLASTVTPSVTSKATIVVGPPKYPMPFAQKIGIGGGMCVVILLPVLWVVANINYYKNPTGAPTEK